MRAVETMTDRLPPGKPPTYRCEAPRFWVLSSVEGPIIEHQGPGEFLCPLVEQIDAFGTYLLQCRMINETPIKHLWVVEAGNKKKGLFGY